MNEGKRQSYVATLKFRTREELETRLAEVESAIKQHLPGKAVGDWYFEREALRKYLHERWLVQRNYPHPWKFGEK